MEKAYGRIKWENYPSVLTPLNETNLNKMDSALDEVDNRILGLDTAKVDKATVNTMVKDVNFDEATGIFTVTLLNGTTKELDTKLEKVATNFRYENESQKLILTLVDGTEQVVDMSSLISEYEFVDGDIISLSVDSDGKVSALVKDGSITEEKLQPNFLADVKTEVEKAKSHSDSSYNNASVASTSAQEAKQYRDEAEQFRNEVEAVVNIDIATTEKAGLVKPDGTTITVDADGTIHSVGSQGTIDYEELENKPSINGVELSGDKSFEDLGFEGTKDYSVLENKPQINGIELSGNKSLSDLGIASSDDLEKVNAKVDKVIELSAFQIQNTASGEEIHLTDSSDAKNVSFGLYGKAEQKQYSGKNLVKITGTSQTINGILYTINDGIITTNGTATESSNLALSDKISVDLLSDNVDYILSGGSANSRIWVNAYDSEKTYKKTLGYDVGSGLSFNKQQFVESEYYYYSIGVYVPKSVMVSDTLYPMIRLASITDDTFEPYVGGTASPNPDYPQEITVSGSDGSVEVVSCGKNVIDQICVPILDSQAKTHFLKAGVYTIARDSVENGKIWFFGAFDGNGSVITESAMQAQSCSLNGSKEYYYGAQNLNTVKITLNNDCYFKVGVLDGLGTTYFMMSKGDKYEPYEPYTETTSTIPTPDGLCGIKVSSGGNYTDENGQQWITDEIVKYADGSGKRVQRIAREAFNGSENWGIDVYENLTIALNQPLLLANETTIISNVVKTTSFNKRNDFTIPIAWVHANNGLLYVRNTGFSLSEWKAYLSENQCDIIYILAEPIITDLSAEEIAEIEKLHTFYPVTNISNDADCGMSITYMADAKNYIDNRLALIESAMLNNI